MDPIILWLIIIVVVVIAVWLWGRDRRKQQALRLLNQEHSQLADSHTRLQMTFENSVKDRGLMASNLRTAQQQLSVLEYQVTETTSELGQLTTRHQAAQSRLEE